jgi:hypothetical protein
MISEYDVGKEIATEDVSSFIEEMNKYLIIKG